MSLKLSNNPYNTYTHNHSQLFLMDEFKFRYFDLLSVSCLLITVLRISIN